MTVQREMERAIAMAEASRGNYLLFAADSEDGQAQQVFRQMAEDMQRHVRILESRKEYLDQHNQLNATRGSDQAGQQGSGMGSGGGKGNGMGSR